MMHTKLFEIRDKGTFIPAIATAVELREENSVQENYLLARSGSGKNPCVLLSRLIGGNACYDAYEWGDRTMTAAHLFIEGNFHTLESGAVVDVEFILKEAQQPKVSESKECPL